MSEIGKTFISVWRFYSKVMHLTFPIILEIFVEHLQCAAEISFDRHILML